MPEPDAPNPDAHFNHLVDLASQRHEPDSSGDDANTNTQGVSALRRVLDSIRLVSRPDESAIRQATSIPNALRSRLGFDKLGAGLAQLVGDTRGVVLAGYRGTATTYALTFETKGVEIHLEVTPPDEDGDKAHIHGHVDLGDQDVQGTARFQRTLDGGHAAHAELDDGGYLAVDLPLGTYDLLIAFADRTIIVPAVEIG